MTIVRRRVTQGSKGVAVTGRAAAFCLEPVAVSTDVEDEVVVQEAVQDTRRNPHSPKGVFAGQDGNRRRSR